MANQNAPLRTPKTNTKYIFVPSLCLLWARAQGFCVLLFYVFLTSLYKSSQICLTQEPGHTKFWKNVVQGLCECFHFQVTLVCLTFIDFC